MLLHDHPKRSYTSGIPTMMRRITLPPPRPGSPRETGMVSIRIETRLQRHVCTHIEETVPTVVRGVRNRWIRA